MYVLHTRRIIARACKAFKIAREFNDDICMAGLPLPTSRADLEPPKGLGLGLEGWTRGLGLGSGTSCRQSWVLVPGIQ